MSGCMEAGGRFSLHDMVPAAAQDVEMDPQLYQVLHGSGLNNVIGRVPYFGG